MTRPTIDEAIERLREVRDYLFFDSGEYDGREADRDAINVVLEYVAGRRDPRQRCLTFDEARTIHESANPDCTHETCDYREANR